MAQRVALVICVAFYVVVGASPRQVMASGPLPSSASPTVRAERTAGSIHLDGVLDEPAWLSTGRIGDLTQQQPYPGEPCAYHTELHVLIKDDMLCFGVRCLDPEPGKISTHTMQRDGTLSGDDHVTIVLDPSGDRKGGYSFGINSAGARRDALISGLQDESVEWDGLWEGKTHRDSTGWSAEIAIPASTLRFDPNLSAWGLNIERFIARDRTTLRWTGATLDANLNDMQRAGRLEGMAGMDQGLGLSVSPYGLGRYQRDWSSDGGKSSGDAGLDLSYSLRPNLTGAVTINTDFAETEVDGRQINLSRFPLFFPEKRLFFLEGSSQFDFGFGLGTEFIPFFSRRMGLLHGERVPIRGGVKLLGREGRTGIGVVGIRTGRIPGAEETSLFVGRLTQDFGPHTRLGVIATDGEPTGRLDNQLYGADLIWQTSTFRGDKNFSCSGWYARSSGERPAGRPDGYGMRIEYPNDLWYASVACRRFGEGLNPGLGFLPRPGRSFYDLGTAFQPRPTSGLFGWVRQFFFELEAERIDDPAGAPESWGVFTAPFNALTQSGEHLEANWAPHFERLTEPFEVAHGVVIPAGKYRYTRYRVEAQSAAHRPWRVGSKVWFGGFYSGHLTQIESFLHYMMPSGQLRLELSSENDFGDLPQGHFVQRLHQVSIHYSFSPDLWIAAFTQYDTESDNLGMNARLQWTIRPGNDLFFVWNRDWERSVAPEEGQGFALERDQITLKARWTFRR